MSFLLDLWVVKLPKPIAVQEVAALLGARLIGDESLLMTGINEIHKVEDGDLTFVDHPKYYERSLQSAATVILINKEMDCPKGKVLLVSEDPFRDYNKLVLSYRSYEPASQAISSSAKIGKGTVIQPGAFVGNHVTIGTNCVINAGACIYDHCILGNDVILHSNVVIGADAYYYQKRDEGYQKLHSCGKVILKDRVEIGANSTVDRGVSGDTIIGEGTKIDNLVQIGHGTVIGKDCLFAAQVGVAGKVTIGDNVILWGQVGVSKDLTIHDNVVVMAQSGVGKTLKAGKAYFGSPAREARSVMKEMALVRKLPEIWEKIKAD